MNTKTICATLLICALVSGCKLSSVKIKNSEWCGDLGGIGADCFNTLNDNERFLSKREWDNERFGMLCTKAENFADWKAALQKLCSKSRRCSYDDKENIIRFNDKIKNFSASVEKVAHPSTLEN